jgi:hypothetical protein
MEEMGLEGEEVAALLFRAVGHEHLRRPTPECERYIAEVVHTRLVDDSANETRVLRQIAQAVRKFGFLEQIRRVRASTWL